MAHREMLAAQQLLRCLRKPSNSIARPAASRQFVSRSSLSSPSRLSSSLAARASSSSTSASQTAAATTTNNETGSSEQQGGAGGAEGTGGAGSSEPPKSSPFYRNPDPNLVVSPRLERRLMRAGKTPVGSRRRRAALQQSSHIPFEQLPYQCFQDALGIIRQDRDEKISEIQTQRARIERLRSATVGNEQVKQDRLRGMMIRLERLKVLADINLPSTKRIFEDGLGDMSKPIYRFLTDRKWREYRRRILMQRITQMKVVPDILAHIDPTVDVTVSFGRRTVQPGAFVNSQVSSTAPKLKAQSFSGGDRLVTIAIVDPDVPNVETDGFDSRCHFLAVNVPLSPTSPSIRLSSLSPQKQVVLPWFPPYSQKGSPYHRLSIFVMQQRDGVVLDHEKIKAKVTRENFSLRRLESQNRLQPVGVHLFRSLWDENTAAVMNAYGIPGADVEFRRRKAPSLPYKRRNPPTMR